MNELSYLGNYDVPTIYETLRGTVANTEVLVNGFSSSFLPSIRITGTGIIVTPQASISPENMVEAIAVISAAVQAAEITDAKG